MSIFNPDPLASKRRHLTNLMVLHYAAKAKAWRDNPGMDINLSDMERNMTRTELESVVRKMPLELLDQLIQRYDPQLAVPRYVY